MGNLNTTRNLPESEASEKFGEFCNALKEQLRDYLITNNQRASSDLIPLKDAFRIFNIPQHYIYNPAKDLKFETPVASDRNGKRVKAISIRNLIFIVYLMARINQSATHSLNNDLAAHIKRVKSTGILNTTELQILADYLHRPSELEIRMQGVVPPENQDWDDEPTQETQTYSDGNLEG